MKLATITLFCNEAFRLEAWKKYYEEYRDCISLHVIVNNGNSVDTPLLRESFPDSMILESSSPNMMFSYNLALREILKNPEIDAIGQIVNDIRIEKDGLRIMWDTLFSRNDLFAISPVLLNKDSDLIDCFGCAINRKSYKFIHLDNGASLASVPKEVRIVDGLPGGIFLAKRSYYERLGFQDESIYMYADEVDMGIRVAAEGLKLAATSCVRAWHQHQQRPGASVQRNPMAAFFIGRNSIYIARKYESAIRVCLVFIYQIFRGVDIWRSALFHARRDGSFAFGWAWIRGAFKGLSHK